MLPNRKSSWSPKKTSPHTDVDGTHATMPLVSDKKRSRLQALESRLSSPVPVSKTTVPLHAIPSGALKPPVGSTSDWKGPVYAQLTKVAFAGPVADSLQMQLPSVVDKSNAVNSIICETVLESGKSVRNLDGVLGSKVQERILLLDNLAGHGKAVGRSQKRAKQSLVNRSRKHLSTRQHKHLGSYDSPLQYQKFDLFEPMHEMWRSYAKEVLNDNRGKATEPNLLQMDYHGAFVAVVEAKVESHVGVEGIMMRETTNTFAIVTMANKIKVIPKAGSVFVLRMDDMCIILRGDGLSRGKAAQKSLRKAATILCVDAGHQMVAADWIRQKEGAQKDGWPYPTPVKVLLRRL